MRVLVACEESQEVCKAFRERGHEAYSCDLQEIALVVIQSGTLKLMHLKS